MSFNNNYNIKIFWTKKAIKKTIIITTNINNFGYSKNII